jgi:hypothetical protein
VTVNPLFKIGIVAGVAFLAWGMTRNVDGPIIHLLLTGAIAWVAWSFVGGM